MIEESYKDKFLRLEKNLRAAKKSMASHTKFCPHDEEIKRSLYHPGDYYDRAYTEEWIECILCGKSKDSKIISVGNFG